MKVFRLIAPLFALILLLMSTPTLHAQVDGDEHSVNIADSLGSTLLNEYDKEFDVVFKAVKQALENEGYVVNYASKKRNLIETEFRILVGENDDNFDEVMEKYGDVPYIRSPGWTVGRTKITVEFDRLDNGKVAVKVQALMSGYEARFTNKWHYWRSNGKLEQTVLDAITAAVDTAG